MSRTYETVKVEHENGIAWVTLNRPAKRNAMSPQLHYEMCDILDTLEHDPQAKVLVLTGAGDAWCAGQDLKLFFRDLDDKPVERTRAGAASHYWRWQKLFTYPKPTIAMVNGFCFGGGFTQLIACDFAIAAEDAQFGLSEVNWGILPGGFVSKALVEALGMRDAVWFAVTGETFDGRVAERARLINRKGSFISFLPSDSNSTSSPSIPLTRPANAVWRFTGSEVTIFAHRPAKRR